MHPDPSQAAATALPNRSTSARSNLCHGAPRRIAKGGFMSNQRSIRLSLAGAIALAMYGVASIATAQPAPQQTMQQQMPPPPPAQPPSPPQGTMPPPPPTEPAQPMPSQNASGQSDSGQVQQGTQSSASYPLPGSNGGTLTVNSGMPANTQNYGPPPSFQSLDTNHDGRISQDEAAAYPPLDSDFLYASGQAKTISRAQYQKWVQDQGE